MRKLTNILLNFGNYVPYNVELAKALGGAEIAIMLSVLINRYNYYFNEGKLDSDGFFYCTAETLEDISAIGGRAQESAIKALIKHEMIVKKVKGLPAKTHYKLHENLETSIEYLLNKFYQNAETGIFKMSKQVPAFCGTSNKEINDKEININNHGEETPPANENEIPPIFDNCFNVSEMAKFMVAQIEKKIKIENADFEVVEKAEPETLNTKKETKEKSSAKKEKKEKPQLKTMIESYPDEESFVNAWGLRFGAKYPNIDAGKAYTKLLQYSLNKGVKYADWVLTAKVWYEKEETPAKRATWEITQTVKSKMQAAHERLFGNQNYDNF